MDFQPCPTLRGQSVETAVIGDGPGSAEVARRLIDALRKRGFGGKLRITLYGESAQVGRGVAWRHGNPLLVCNMPARTMSVDPGQPDQLMRAMGSLAEAEGSVSPLPRSEIGDALSARWEETLRRGSETGIEIEHVKDAVLDVVRTPTGFEVRTRRGEHRLAHYVVLAVGNAPPTTLMHLRGIDGYYPNPWSFHRVDDVFPKAARVAVLGNGPTAIDTAILFYAATHGGPITFYSRTGKFPWVRPRYNAQATPQVLTESLIEETRAQSGPLSWEEIRRLFLTEALVAGVGFQAVQHVCRLADRVSPRQYLQAGLAKADSHPEWFNVLKRIDETLPHLWNAASDQAKAHLWQHIRGEHARISYAMPAANARLLLAMLDAGALRVVGGFKDVKSAPGRKSFLIELANASRPEEADVVINTMGMGTDLDKVEDPLVRNLRQSGLLSRNPFGGSNADFVTGQIIDEHGDSVEGLYALAGSLTIGVQGVINSLLKVSKSAIRTADAIADRLVTA